MDRRPYQPNVQLRNARLLRNWTYKETARELNLLMLSRGETQAAVTLQMIYRWERGEFRPSMFYRRYFCLLYHSRPDELGFLPEEVTPREESLAKEPAQPSPSGTSHDAGSPVSEDELEALNLTRRQLLAASGFLGAAVGTETATEALGRVAEPIERAARVASGRAAADDALIADLHAFNVRFDGARRRAPSGLLIEPVRAHIDLTKAVLQQSLLPEQREALLNEAAHACRLMALLQADEGGLAASRHWVAQSIAMGNETRDIALHVDGLLLAAEVELWMEGGEAYKALRLLSHGHELARRACSPNVRAWVLATQAYAHASLRQPEEVPRLLYLSASTQQCSRPGDEPWWAESWDQTRVTEYVGTVHLELEQPGPARAALQQTLADVAPDRVKLRAGLLADVAMTYALQGEVEQACEIAGKALDLPLPLLYRSTLNRVRTVRRRLSPWQTQRAVKDLDERLRAVA